MDSLNQCIRSVCIVGNTHHAGKDGVPRQRGRRRRQIVACLVVEEAQVRQRLHKRRIALNKKENKSKIKIKINVTCTRCKLFL